METTVTVTGMHCASCATGIETVLRSQEEINRASVEYDTGQLTIEHTDALDLAALWQRIEGMGYGIDEPAPSSGHDD